MLKQYEKRTRSLSLYLRLTSFPSINIGFVMAVSFKKIVAQLVFNCPLLPTSQNNLARKRPMTSEFLATPPVGPIDCIVREKMILTIWINKKYPIL